MYKLKNIDCGDKGVEFKVQPELRNPTELTFKDTVLTKGGSLYAFVNCNPHI